MNKESHTFCFVNVKIAQPLHCQLCESVQMVGSSPCLTITDFVHMMLTVPVEAVYQIWCVAKVLSMGKVHTHI